MAQTILVVEDDGNIAQVVAEYLKEAGYIARVCGDGAAACELIEAGGDIHLFVLDIMLPGRTGLELLRDIRESEIYHDTPVIMLTALNDEYTQLISFDGLADDYVTKPFSPKLLVRRVGALLRRAGKGASLTQVGPLSVDFEAFEVHENGERVNLTLREFELLGCLIHNAKKVLSRQQLLNHVWGYDYFGDERVVDVHIKNLRKKLHTGLISTVKGIGYKLELPPEGGNGHAGHV